MRTPHSQKFTHVKAGEFDIQYMYVGEEVLSHCRNIAPLNNEIKKSDKAVVFTELIEIERDFAQVQQFLW